MNKYFLIVLGIISSGLAQVMLKKSGEFQFLKDFLFFVYFIAGGAFYALSFGLYLYLLKIFNLSKISPVMTVATMIFVVIASILIFKENITLKQGVGIILGILSVFLIIK